MSDLKTKEFLKIPISTVRFLYVCVLCKEIEIVEPSQCVFYIESLVNVKNLQNLQ